MTSKKRKYGDLSARPLPTNDPSLLDDVFAAFTGARPAPPESVPEADSGVTDASPEAVKGVREGSETVAQRATPAQHATAAQYAAVAQHAVEPWHGATAAQYAAVAQRATVPGFTRMSNDLLDRILPTLDAYDQVVLIRLYRLSRGFNSDVCRASHSTLASACNISARQVRISLCRLAARGLIERVERDFANSDVSLRGTIYRVLISDPAVAQRATPAQHATAAQYADIKERKAFKENLKKKVRRLTPEEIESFATAVADLVAGGKTFEEAESQFAGGMHPMDWVTVKSVASAQAQVRKRQPAGTGAAPAGEQTAQATESGGEGE